MDARRHAIQPAVYPEIGSDFVLPPDAHQFRRLGPSDSQNNFRDRSKLQGARSLSSAGCRPKQSFLQKFSLGPAPDATASNVVRRRFAAHCFDPRRSVARQSNHTPYSLHSPPCTIRLTPYPPNPSPPPRLGEKGRAGQGEAAKGRAPKRRGTSDVPFRISPP